MNKKTLILPFVIFSFIFVAFFNLLLKERNPSEIPSNLINKKIPEFETESLLESEKFLSVEEFGNEVALVNFFASWCKPCRDEHVYIKRFSNEKKIKIIGINYKDKSQKAIQWLKKLGNPYSSIPIDKKGRIAIDWGVYGIPETFVVSPKKIIRYRHIGPITEKSFKKINLIINEIRNDN